MNVQYCEVQSRGQAIRVPCIQAGNRTIVSLGRWLRVASVFDEAWFTRADEEPLEKVLSLIRETGLPADLYTFSQEFFEREPKYPHHWELDNAAAIRVTNYAAWWDALPQETRKNVRRSKREGVEVREIPFNDELVQGIVEVYNADAVRQSGRFWHYGKGFDAVKAENSSYVDRSSFLGAYFQGELIGFMKMVYVGASARMMQIVAKNAHRDKRPMNQLISHAVELCEQRGKGYLIYGKFEYGNQGNTSLQTFKLRNGFEKLDYPVYYVPVSLKGRLALGLRLHHGPRAWIPRSVVNRLVGVRNALRNRGQKPAAPAPGAAPAENGTPAASTANVRSE